MKLACSSTAFDALLRSGELTQLEWIDSCAHELAVDGAVLDVRHFPRTDTDYLAQVKKMAADLGLTVAALRHDGFFALEEPAMLQALEMAATLGAPLLSAPLPPETACSWGEVQQALGTATGQAKRLNVTLALRNVPHTFAASTHDMKRASKEADSAWLRYGPDFETLEAGSDAESLLGKTVLAWASFEHAASAAKMLGGYIGFVALDDAEGSATFEQAKSALREWRGALFEVVNRT